MDMTFDQALKLAGTRNHPGKPLGHSYLSHDGKTTYDSTGAFLVGELERLDQTFHGPLVAVSWQRDIQLREDVTIADEVSSFTQSTFGAVGGLGTGQSIGNGKAWMGKTSTQIQGVSVDIGKVTNPLTPWAQELIYDILELESAARVGRPVDAQKHDAIKLKHQMDIDEQVYFGDSTTGAKGLINNAGVTPVNVVAGAAGGTQWQPSAGYTGKTPDEILSDFNTAIVTTWAAAAWAVMPHNILIPPPQYGYISTQKVSLAGNESILNYILKNNVATQDHGAKIEIHPLKWLQGAGVGGTIGTPGQFDRMVVYTNEKNYVRFPMTMINQTPLQYDGLYHKKTYYCRLGVVEVVYPQTIGYFDGI